jgi:hypothetical protein
VLVQVAVQGGRVGWYVAPVAIENVLLGLDLAAGVVDAGRVDGVSGHVLTILDKVRGRRANVAEPMVHSLPPRFSANLAVFPTTRRPLISRVQPTEERIFREDSIDRHRPMDRRATRIARGRWKVQWPTFAAGPQTPRGSHFSVVRQLGIMLCVAVEVAPNGLSATFTYEGTPPRPLGQRQR